MSRLVRYAKDGAIMVAVVFLLFEVTLRVVPGLIPPTFLVFFNESLRASIAERLALPTEADVRSLTRTDGGPRLDIYRPNTTITNQFTDLGTSDVTVDANGFCNDSTESNERAHFDVITIGDSFTFCTTTPPDTSWSAVLQDQTGQSVYNLGSPAKGLYEYVQIFETFGITKAPETVIMAVYEGNDLRDARKYHDFRSQAGTGRKDDINDCGVGRVCQTYMKLINSRAGQYSYAFNTLLVSVRLTRGAAYNTAASLETLPDFTYTIEGPEGVVVLNPNDTDIDEVLHADMLAAGEISLDLFDEALERFVALGEVHSFEPVVVYIPSAYTAYAAEVTFVEEGVGHRVASFSQQQRTYFETQTAALSVRFVDTTPALQAVAADYVTADRLLYFPQNVHLTAFGHAVVAETITANVFTK